MATTLSIAWYARTWRGVAAESVLRNAAGEERSNQLGRLRGLVDEKQMSRSPHHVQTVVDPPFTKNEKEGWAEALYDTRTEQGTRLVFGGSRIYPSQVLAVPKEFIDRYPSTAFLLVRAIVEALRYIHSHSATQVAALMPAEYKQGEPDTYAASLAKNIGLFSPDGIMPAEGPSIVMSILRATIPGAADVKVDLSATFEKRFARTLAAT